MNSARNVSSCFANSSNKIWLSSFVVGWLDLRFRNHPLTFYIFYQSHHHPTSSGKCKTLHVSMWQCDLGWNRRWCSWSGLDVIVQVKVIPATISSWPSFSSFSTSCCTKKYVIMFMGLTLLGSIYPHKTAQHIIKIAKPVLSGSTPPSAAGRASEASSHLVTGEAKRDRGDHRFCFLLILLFAIF